VSKAPDDAAGPGVPPPQHNLQDATDKAIASLADQSPEQMVWLGAQESQGRWRLTVLGESLDADPATGSVRDASGREVSHWWRILVLHYLDIRSRVSPAGPGITFADLPAARAYSKVYQGRVIGRLCATAARDLATLRAAAESLGCRETEGGDAAFDADIFPHITIRLIWHAADEEFPPSATLLLPDSIAAMLCIEDIVVLSESFVARLSGRPF
jgi:hypothetical protein